MRAAKRGNPAVVIALALLLAIVAAVPAVATIPVVDLGAGDLGLVAALPATSPLLPPAELPIALPPPAHAPPAASLEGASDHHFRIAVAIAFARVNVSASERAEAKNRIRGSELSTSLEVSGAKGFRPQIAPGDRETDAFYLADHQGSIRFLLDGTGSTLNQYTYDGFGRSLVATEAIQNPYTYTAREQDPETGHLHYRARAYDPNIGRFLASDPIGFAGGDANLYAYVGNDPVNFSDPSGLITPWDAVDVISFFISLNDFRNCPGFGTGFFALADLAGAVLPVIPALGTLRHAANAVDGVVDIANGADNIADGARGIENLAGGVPRGPSIKPSPTSLDNGTFYVDEAGNVISTPPGGSIAGSPDGQFVQALGPDGKPTGVRIDGGHPSHKHSDPRAQAPHGHVPGVTNSDGTPWLPIKQQ